MLRPDGTARATSWTKQALFPQETAQAELTWHFREDGSLDSIDIDGEDSPLEGGIVQVSKLDLYDTPDAGTRPSMTVSEGEHLVVVALQPFGWLQVRTAGGALKWVRYGDLRGD
ncbi:hypothetical protein D3C72_1773440 [compost metagenome]